MGKLSKRKKQRQASAAAASLHDASVASSLPAGAGHVSDDEEMAGLESHAGAVRGAVDLEEDVMAGVSPEELVTAIKVATALGKNLDVFRTRIFKPLRRALHPLVEDMTSRDESAPNDGSSGKGERSRKRSRHREPGEDSSSLTADEQLKQRDLELINSRLMRAARLKKLEEMGREGKDEETAKETVFRVPDGVALDDGPGARGLALEGGPAVLQLADGSAGGSGDSAAAGSADGESEKPAVLHYAIPCYTCKKSFRELHEFYDQLCPVCAQLNFLKRNQVADLRGKVCLVTGARVKIGYRCCLKLLRCGATVIATSRFPVDACQRFAAEVDFDDWSANLQVYGLDFRDLSALEKFCEHVRAKYTRLDALVNNACQTIRRPPSYYTHMLPLERAPEKAPAAQAILPLLNSHTSFEQGLLGGSSARLALAGMGAAEDGSDVDGSNGGGAAAGGGDEFNAVSVALSGDLGGGGGAAQAGAASAELSQVSVIAGDSTSAKHMPKERDASTGQMVAAMDQSGQQVDLRKRNSWLLKLDEVSVGEAAEVLAINTLAPFVLNAQLRTLMERSPDDWKFIVNVSAMEGKFYRFKTSNHPHTNMAKAALNMMTRTSAQDYRSSQIYMTAVDTGWINDEKPVERAAAHEKRHAFQTPLDEVDAAARILDPILAPCSARDLCKGDQAKIDALPEPQCESLKPFLSCL